MAAILTMTPLCRVHLKSHRLTRTLITLPDLSEKETLYVKTQIASILKPKYFKYLDSEASGLLDCDEDGKPKIDLNDPDVILQFFPPVGKRFALESCLKIVRSNYADFQIPDKEPFTRHLRYPHVTERTVNGLRVCGATPLDLQTDPTLAFVSLHTLSRFIKVSDITEGQIHVSRMQDFLTKEPLRGTHIRNKIQRTQRSLAALGFESFGAQMMDAFLRRFSRNSATKYRDIDLYLVADLRQHLCQEADVSEADTKRSGFRQGDLIDPQDVARNMYVMRHLLGLDMEGKTGQAVVKAAFKLEPLEVLVSLNVFHEVFKKTDPELSETEFLRQLVERQLWRTALVSHSVKFPVTFRYLWLRSLGFRNEDVMDLCRTELKVYALPSDVARKTMDASPEECASSANLKLVPFTHPMHFPLLKERAEVMRRNPGIFNVKSPSAELEMLRTWPNIMKKLAECVDENGCSNQGGKVFTYSARNKKLDCLDGHQSVSAKQVQA